MRTNLWITAITLVIIVGIALPASAQESFRLSEIVVSSGDDTISSGITGVVRFTNERGRLLEVAVQHDQAWVLYGPKFKIGSLSGLIAGSVGHHQGAPWAGPLLSLKVPVAKNISLSTFHWPGVYVWEPRDWKTENDGVDNPERLAKGYIGSAQVNVGPVGLVYSWQNFLDEPWNKLPGVAYTQNIRDDTSLTGSATWNSNKEKWMLYVGLTWKPKQ